MKTQLASKFTLKFLTIAKNWPVLLLAAFLLAGCPGGDGSEGAAPANPNAVGGDQRVTVTWDGSAGASSYNVYWSTASGIGTDGTLENVSASPFYHDGVTNAQPYYYVVTAVNEAGESGASGQVTATPVDILLSGLLLSSLSHFVDGNLESCVSKLRDRGIEHVHDLTSLGCSGGITRITKITGIEALTSLTDLDLIVNNIADVSALAGLTNLTKLALGDNSITGISDLSGLTSLTELNLRNNRNITDISALASLTNLTYLYLAYNTITDVSVLASLTSLAQLYLNNNTIGGQGVGNVDDLKSLVNASRIDLTGNTDMSCSELSTLIGALNTDTNTVVMPDTATDGTNCKNP